MGEEICGLPGIGTFEAMACGCVVFANKNSLVGIVDQDDCYIDIGNKDITQYHPMRRNIPKAELERISNNAIRFVNEHLRKESSVERFKQNFDLS